MKEATGETSMVVITIIVVALLAGIGTLLFNRDGGIVTDWIRDTFEEETGATTGNNG